MSGILKNSPIILDMLYRSNFFPVNNVSSILKVLILTRISHKLWEKLRKLFFESPNKVLKGRFVNLSKKACSMNRETDVKDFSGDGEKYGLRAFMAIASKHSLGNSTFGYSLHLSLQDLSHKSFLFSALSQSNSHLKNQESI